MSYVMFIRADTARTAYRTHHHPMFVIIITQKINHFIMCFISTFHEMKLQKQTN
ncbi:MAG: hypothetical protein ACI8RD_006139 [Bacillariaceae sp.]|jgi:hypothetical protein